MSSVDRKLAATLYINLLLPWENKIKVLIPKGNFNIRSKAFIHFRRCSKMMITVKANRTLAHEEIENYIALPEKIENRIILAKGAHSISRVIFRQLRNSIAHGNVEVLTVKRVKLLRFVAMSNDRRVFFMQVKNIDLDTFISSLLSTVKNV